MSWARSALHHFDSAQVWDLLSAQLSGHAEGIADAFVSVSVNAHCSADSGTFHVFPVAKSGSVSCWFITFAAGATMSLSLNDVWKVVLEVASFCVSGLWSLGDVLAAVVAGVVHWSVEAVDWLMSSDLGS